MVWHFGIGVVLTAAHCVEDMDPKKLKVRAGEWNTQKISELYAHQDRQVRDYVIHPQYTSSNLFNDIALLFLTDPVEIAPHVNIACLPSQDENIESEKCIATGWGRDQWGIEGKHHVILKRVDDLPIVKRDYCLQKLRETRLGPEFELHPSFICAGKIDSVFVYIYEEKKKGRRLAILSKQCIQSANLKCFYSID